MWKSWTDKNFCPFTLRGTKEGEEGGEIVCFVDLKIAIEYYTYFSKVIVKVSTKYWQIKPQLSIFSIKERKLFKLFKF